MLYRTTNQINKYRKCNSKFRIRSNISFWTHRIKGNIVNIDVQVKCQTESNLVTV